MILQAPIPRRFTQKFEPWTLDDRFRWPLWYRWDPTTCAPPGQQGYRTGNVWDDFLHEDIQAFPSVFRL